MSRFRDLCLSLYHNNQMSLLLKSYSTHHIFLESDSKVIKDLLWGRRFVKNTNENKNNNDNDNEDSQESEPLAVILINTMFHLLFLPDFTIEDPNVDFNESDINSIEFKTSLMW